MIIHLPPSDAFQAGRAIPPQSHPSAGYILHERARTYHWAGDGVLSIKAFFSGQAFYEAGGGCYAVDDTCYLILNHGQPYTITIAAPSPVESLCVFFAPGLVEEAQQCLTACAERLLDAPQRRAAALPPFFERTYRHYALVSPVLHELRALLAPNAQGPPDRAVLIERVHELALRLLQVQRGVHREVEALPAVRAATREEIYRRVYRAVDYARAMLDQPLTLADLARVACLSPTHLLRLFPQVVGQTPHQYLIAARLEQAQRLLRHTDRPVTEICHAVGFHSLGSFSWLFQRRVGLAPAAYRRCFR
jgi:AraC-like DNA-binding protein